MGVTAGGGASLMVTFLGVIFIYSLIIIAAISLVYLMLSFLWERKVVLL